MKVTILLVCTLLITFANPAESADKKVAAKSSTVKKITAQQEQSSLRFAKQHHPELSTLLAQLKEMDAGKYRSAILELSRTNERLERFRTRSPERHQTELSLWKIDSRIRLLVARSVSGMEEQTRQELKKLLLKRNQIRLTQYTQEHERLRTRIDRLDDQISQLTDSGDSLAEQDLDRLLKSAHRLSKNRKAATSVNNPSKTSLRSKEKTKTPKSTIPKPASTKSKN